MPCGRKRNAERGGGLELRRECASDRCRLSLGHPGGLVLWAWSLMPVRLDWEDHVFESFDMVVAR